MTMQDTPISKQNTLALLGGDPSIVDPLTPFESVGEDEVVAATRVIRSGVLSGYIGAPGEAFLGGREVRAFEDNVARHFGVEHAVAVNSLTSGLIAAVAAIGIEPGDEIITSPWTMTATASAILHVNGIPVFADIDPMTFNIDPVKVEALITSRTKAILAIDIFGQSADILALQNICERHSLVLLSDCAQAPGSYYNDKPSGTLADIGGYSFNAHKHVQCGEGGVLVTNNSHFAERLRLIRNHGEAVVNGETPPALCNMLGYNFRLGEIESAIASIQLTKLEARVRSRQLAAEALNNGLSCLEGLQLPVVSDGCTHAYYIYGMTLDIERLGVSRKTIVEALCAEGVPGLMEGYQNLHCLPLFTKKIAYGTHGFPWNSAYCTEEVNYGEGVCPVAEALHQQSFLGLNLCMYEFTPREIAMVVAAFNKVWRGMASLKTRV